MTDLSGLKQGDPVRVFERYRAGTTPEGGFEGTVQSVRRKYLVAEYNVQGFTRTCEVLIETGVSNDGYSHYSVMQPEEVELDLRRRAALTTMRSVGFSWNQRGYEVGPISLGLLEALAATVETWGQEATE